jgi:hypothetical protein
VDTGKWLEAPVLKTEVRTVLSQHGTATDPPGIRIGTSKWQFWQVDMGHLLGEVAALSKESSSA